MSLGGEKGRWVDFNLVRRTSKEILNEKKRKRCFESAKFRFTFK